MHLLPNATEVLEEQLPGYNWPSALACAGVILVLSIEQIVLLVNLSEILPEEVKIEDTFYKIQNSEIGWNATDNPLFDDHSRDGHHNKSVLKTEPEHDHDHDHTHSQHETHIQEPLLRVSHDHAEHDHILNNVLKSNGLQKLITAYILEISIAIHSIIIGVDLGLMSSSDETFTLCSLMIALSFHQFIEGIGLGSTIHSSREALGNAKVMGFVCIFSLSMPMGIVIGILSTSTHTTSAQLIAKGVADAFATGSLLYISLSEMVPNYFGASDLKHLPNLRIGMLWAFSSGVVMMAIIAIWA